MAKTVVNDTVDIPVGKVTLAGDLVVPENARGLVIFSHGSGSSRLSPRNKAVAQHLHEAGFATLLFDLLTPQEGENEQARFDIPLLTERLIGVTGWAQKQEQLRDLDIGYFGASTGAASALGAAAALIDEIKAVVSRGGRTDLAETVLADVLSPTLLIVGGKDNTVVSLNRQAQDMMRCIKDVEIVPDATHLFEEPGALEMAADLALDWFKKYLAMDKQRPLIE